MEFELTTIVPIRGEALDYETISSLTDAEIQQWRDARGYSLLMCAAEDGETKAVNYLIEKGEDLDFEVDGNSAASLAFNNGNHEIVLSLIKSNAKFPNNYSDENVSDDLKTFVELSQEMHEKVRNCDEQEEESLTQVENFIGVNCQRFPTMRHFYNTNNCSLLKTAILSRMFEIYKILLSLNIFLGKDESVDDIVRELNDDDKEDMRRINAELSTHLFTAEMMILMRNCKLGPGVTDHGFYIEFIRKAFDFLFKINPVVMILKVVAAKRDFKIIFDFKRDSVQFLDPFQELYTNGICYSGGRIYIAAMDMLDPENAHKVYAVMAHELCHFAMFLTYENEANPYRHFERLTEENFQEITQECQVLSEIDLIIYSVFVCYPPEMYHAELIVRVPQMLVTYFYETDFLSFLRGTFSKLFDFYELNVVSEMESELTRIQRENNPNKEIEEKVGKLKRWNIFLIVSLSFLIPIGIGVIFYVYSPTFSWSTLTEEQKFQFKNSTVNFYGVDVKFGELFADDSNIYEKIPSEHLKFGLDGDSFNLTNALNLFYKENIFLVYSNMSQSLKENFVGRKLNFQGEKIEIKKILRNSEALNFLTQSQVREFFEGNPVNISKQVEPKTKFYINRFFVDEAARVDLNSDYYKENGEIFEDKAKNFDEILEELEIKKVFLLSSVAGEGKSTTLRNFAIKLKKNNTENWIQFVDLKKHFEVYEKGLKTNLKDVGELLKFLTFHLLNLNELESEIFKELFGLDRVTFFWDGIDEISPLYKDFMIDLTWQIKKSSNCTQFISTRPNQFSKDFLNRFQVNVYKFVPFGRSSRYEFIVKFVTIETFNLNGEEIWRNLKEIPEQKFENVSFIKSLLNEQESDKFVLDLVKARKVLSSIEKSGLVTNPILLRMLSEILESKQLDENSSLNLYSIYETFIYKKLKITQNKGPVAAHDFVEILGNSEVNLMQVHQAYALKNFFQFTDVSNVTILKQNLSNSQISRFGIIEILSENRFYFAHRTFAEFFVARFIIDNFKHFDIDNFGIDSTQKIYLLNSVLFSEEYESIKNFLLSFLKLENQKRKVFEVFQNFPKFSEFLENISSESNFRSYFEELLNTRSGNFLVLYQKYNEKLDQTFQNNSELKNQFLLGNIEGDTLSSLNILHEVFLYEKNHETCLKIFELLNKKLNVDEIRNLIKAKTEIVHHFNIDEFEATPLMFASWKARKDNIESFWNFINEKFDRKETKEILLLQSDLEWTTLEFSTWNNDPKTFVYVKELYEKFFSEEDIRNSLTTNSEYSFILNVIKYASLETAQEVSKFLENLFKNQKIELRKILSRRNWYDSMFSYYKDKKESQEKLKVFIQLLRTTFEENQEEVFETLLTVLKIKSGIELEGSENVKEILLTKNSRSETFLHELFGEVWPDRDSIEFFLNTLKQKLNKSEILELIFTKDSIDDDAFDERIPLMLAASWLKLKYLRVFWKFLEETLNEEEKRKILLEKDKFSWTALQYSMWSKDPKSFLFVKEIYNKTFTYEEIRYILMGSKNIPFKNVLRFSNPETIQEVSKFLLNLFQNQKVELRKFLCNQSREGHSYLTSFPDYDELENNLKLLIKLLRQTFEENEELDFEILLMTLKLRIKINLEDFGNVKDILFGNYGYNETILHKLFDGRWFVKNEDLTENFLSKIQAKLSKNEIKSLVFAQEIRNNQSSLMKAAWNGNLKALNFFWKFLNESLNDEDKRILLRVESKGTMTPWNFWTALQYSTHSKNPNLFLFVKELFELFFTQEEIREMLMKIQRNEHSFIFNVVEDATPETAEEVSKFLENLFKNQKIELRKILSQRDRYRESIFSYFKARESFFNKRTLKFFIELLRKTFEENQEEEFLEYLSALQTKR